MICFTFVRWNLARSSSDSLGLPLGLWALPARCSPAVTGVEHVGGDMFESVPSADGIFIKNVLHDWNDDQCRVILRNCHTALPENGKIILAEAVMGDEEEGEGKQSAKSPWDSLKLAYNVLMIAHSGGAVERSRKQWEDLLTACGFCGVKIHDGGVGRPISIIEAYKTT